MPSTDIPKRPRAGTRVVWTPNPASVLLYSNRSELPEPGELGTIQPMQVPGAGRVTSIPGPGGGLVYVKWDNGSFFGVSRYDILLFKGEEPQGKEASMDLPDVLLMDAPSQWSDYDYELVVTVGKDMPKGTSSRLLSALERRGKKFADYVLRELDMALTNVEIAGHSAGRVTHTPGSDGYVKAEIVIKNVPHDDMIEAAEKLARKLGGKFRNKVRKTAADKTAMPEKYEVTVYKFDELDSGAKAIALDKLREIVYEMGIINEDIEEDYEEELKKLGYPTKDIRWRLSHSQGDGMAFYGRLDRDDIKKIARRIMPATFIRKLEKVPGFDWNSLDAKIYPNSYGSHYSHYNTMEVSFDTSDVEREIMYEIDDDKKADEAIKQLGKLIDELEWAVQEDVREVSKKLEKAGYDIIDKHTNDEKLEDFALYNEFRFDEDGNIDRRRR